MIKLRPVFFLATALFCLSLNAQSVMDADPAAQPAPGNLDMLDGLAGRWLGESANGSIEAHFSEPRFGQMVGHITYWNDSGYFLIELVSYAEREGSLVYRVKHFDAAFHGRQERADSVERRLLDYRDRVAYFEDMSVRLDGDRLTIYLNLGGNVLQVNYRRAND